MPPYKATSERELIGRFMPDPDFPHSRPLPRWAGFSIAAVAAYLLAAYVICYIDRVDVAPDGSIAICDYKTGRARPQRDVDGDRQLTADWIACGTPAGA